MGKTSSNDLMSASLNGMGNTKEKVNYLGDLRIIGQVVINLSDKSPIGYVVMVEKTQKFKMYTVAQTVSLLAKFKFVNAEYKGGKIVNTECSMDRLPKFDGRMNVIGNFGVIILGEITDGTKKLGYRAIDCNAKIVDISEDELLKLNGSGVDILNAKVVNRNGKQGISGIKSEFTKIEKSKLKDLKIKEAETPESQWRKEMHVQKWIDMAPTFIANYFRYKGRKVINSKVFIYKEKDGYIQGTFNYNMEAKIICKEIIADRFKFDGMGTEDKELLAKIIKSMPHHEEYCYRRDDNQDSRFEIALLQFFLFNSGVYEKAYKKVKLALGGFEMKALESNDSAELSEISSFIESEWCTSEFRNFATLLINRVYVEKKEMRERSNRYKMIEKYGKFRTKSFIASKDIAQLGFSIVESGRGYKFSTENGGNKTLKYLGDMINMPGEQLWSKDDYESAKKSSRCLGDIMTVVIAMRMLSRVHQNIDLDIEYPDFLDGNEPSIILMMIAIAYLYDNKAMKEFVDKYRSDIEDYTQCNDLPDYESISSMDYMLSPELKLYYESGFCVFKNDNKEFKHRYLLESEILNYRNLGPEYRIGNPLITEELASIVNMVTPDVCEAETIDKFIGNLRFF